MKLLEGEYGFKTITVMVQKEVADRYCSKPGMDGYGAITAAINYYASVKRLFTVKAGSFDPKPKVDSAVIRFDIYKNPPVSTKDKALFFNVIKGAFSQRRKTLLNSLGSFFNNIISKQELAEIITNSGWDENIRGETLDISDFAILADAIFDFKNK